MLRYKNDLLCGSKTQMSFQLGMRRRTAPHLKFVNLKGIKAFQIEELEIIKYKLKILKQ